jgi:signal transduction histidine kinase
MNIEPRGEPYPRSAPLADLARGKHQSDPIDAELEAAQRALESEHVRLAEALSRAEGALAMRDEVLAIVAHDLRAPLNAVQTSAAFLIDVELGEADRRRLLEVIRRASNSMNRLIQDLLDVSRMESGAFTIDPERVDFAALARDVCEQFHPQAGDAGPVLECSVDGELPYVIADRGRMSQVLENLVSNALRFTPTGGSVTVRVRRTEGGRVACEVEDTGVGIAPEDLPHLFERFWQARRYRRGGAGLGLAIARGVVEAHGSTLAVRSQPGRGSVFSFELPAE